MSLVVAGCGESQPALYWTLDEAESIRVVRGTTLRTVDCRGIGEVRSGTYSRFRCVGTVVEEAVPELPVRVRYVLNPRGAFDGARSAYLATSVRFDSFGVP